MIFGMPTLIECQSIEENAALARRLGLQFIELNMNLPYCTLGALKKADLQKIGQEFGIHFTLHADENLFFCDFNERVASAHLETMLDTIVFCKSLHIPLINFHMSPGVYFTLPNGKQYLFDIYSDHYMHCIHRFRDACEKAAGDSVALCIENTGHDLPFLQKGMEALLSSPAFHLTWDIGHDYSAGNADRPFIMEHLHRLRHMHIHGAAGKKNHLSLKGSKLNWKECLETGRPERAVIEVKTAQFLAESVSILSAEGG
ncbi:MAG: sugar phosphate isomerase/epimerase [Clostridiales bacterium]|nr:sugar phosphate isomerase/epimerase [Clostridiales bacterium]